MMMSPIHNIHIWSGRLVGIGLVLLFLASCASTPPSIQRLPTPPKVESQARSKVMETAQQMLGTPYRPGGSSPRGFDCSGLVRYSFNKAGIHVPRTSAQQYSQSQKISQQSMQPGDLIFFNIRGRKISHVGIYLGQGQFVHAPSSGKAVRIDYLSNPYWKARIRGAGHYF